MATYTDLHFEAATDSLAYRLFQRMQLQRQGHAWSWIMLIVITTFSLYHSQHAVLSAWPELRHAMLVLNGLMLFPAIADAMLWARGNKPMLRRWGSLLENYRAGGGDERQIDDHLSEQAYRTGCQSLRERARSRWVLLGVATSGVMLGGVTLLHAMILPVQGSPIPAVAWSVVAVGASLQWLRLWGKNAFID